MSTKRLRIPALFMIVSMALLCIGCTKEPEEGPKTVSRPKISFSLIDLNSGQNNTGEYAEEILQKIEDYCGTGLELIWIPNDTLSEKNSQYLASPKTMPDIMSWGGTVTGDVISAANSGIFVDLNDYVWDSEAYPNLSAMSKDVAANLTVGGKLIGIPRTRVIGREGLSYRTDWAEALNVELPENATPEDVYRMLYAFTYGDPDGDGEQNTIGMEMTNYTGPFDIIQTWFGCGNGWQDVNGKLVPVWTTDEYFEAVDFIKRLYDDGLMPKDWALRPTETWSNGCKNGENGVFIDVLDGGKRIWQYFENEATLTPSVVNDSIPASMTLYGAVNGHTLATAGYNGYFTLSANSLDTPDKIKMALTLLDRLCDEEMLILTQYGLEDINYTWAGEKIIDTDKNDSALTAGYKGLNQMLSYLPTTEQAVVPVVEDKFSVAQDEAYAKALKCAVSNPALSYLVTSKTYALAGDSFDEQVNELRTKYICGVISKEEFRAELNVIMTSGYNQIIIEVNTEYHKK